MWAARRLLAALALGVLAGACAPAASTDPGKASDCPGQVIAVLAVENFYASLVNQIGGSCVATTTVLSDPNADPHEYQPVASDVRAYQRARLVVENGLGYDDFSDKVIATLSTPPKVVRMGDVLGLQVGANPHVWYSAEYVDRMRAAILTGLKEVAPETAGYFDAQALLMSAAFAPYHALIAQIAAQYRDQPVGATETIFELMAQSTGLRLITPPDLMQAIAEGNDPSARDIAYFQGQIKSRQIKVLVYNTQTVTTLTDQFKAMAEQNNIPIVGVSETMPADAATFQDWQVAQLQALLAALQRANG